MDTKLLEYILKHSHINKCVYEHPKCFGGNNKYKDKKITFFIKSITENKCVKELLKYKDDVDIYKPDEGGQLPFMYACEYHRIDIVKWFLEEFKQNHKKIYNEECGVCKEKNTNVKLSKCNHNYHKNCIERWYYAKKSCAICRKEFKLTDIKNCCDYINWRDNNGRTALMYASGCKGNDKIVKLLIDAKCNVNLQNKYGRTALMSATRRSLNHKTVKLLIDAKCNVNLQTNTGYTALLQAVQKPEHSVRELNYKTVKLLIDAGAEINDKIIKEAFKTYNKNEQSLKIFKYIIAKVKKPQILPG